MNGQPVFTMPIALTWRKPGRGRHGRCVGAKITFFVGSRTPILATAWRSQSGTSEWISVPQAAIRFAEQAGATEYYLRDDRRMLMWRIPLQELKRTGVLKRDGERYFMIRHMEPVPWREWLYAVDELDMSAIGDGGGADGRAGAGGRQLSLFDTVAFGAESTGDGNGGGR